MDEEMKKSFARKGGLASAQAKKTSNRGFASMDKAKLKMISSMGGKASKSVKLKNEEEEADRGEGAGEEDLTSLEREDERESSAETMESLSYSETDEDEDEGLGDGNMGRTTRESADE